MNPTCFSEIIGNEDVKNRLKRMISKKAIGHALLFAGPEGVGKGLFAWALAASVIGAGSDHCESDLSKIRMGMHPDVHIYRPEGKLGLHSLHSLRQLSEEVHLPPYEANWKVFIIHDADRMLSYSANALLKTFEEPPARTLIILLSRSPAALLPTIISRCSTLHFRALPSSLVQGYLKERYSLDDLSVNKIVRQSQGSLGRAVRLVEEGDGSRSYLLKLLAQGGFQDYKALQEGVQFLSEQVEAAKKHVEEAAKGELSKLYKDQLSLQQQHALEKELEGVVALVLTQEARFLFEHLLSWYRDMHLLLVGGDVSFLFNPDFQEEIEQAVQRGAVKPLEQVYQAVEDAYLSLQRSTSLSLCLENLLLKLDHI